MNVNDRLYRAIEVKERFYQERNVARAALQGFVDWVNAADPQDPRIAALMANARAVLAPEMPTDAQVAATLQPCGK